MKIPNFSFSCDSALAGRQFRQFQLRRFQVVVIILLQSWTPSGAASSCPAYESSELYRPRTRQVTVDPLNWISTIEGAQSGDEILLADGSYDLDQYAVQITREITVRSASGNRDAVIIRGQGYGTPSEGLMITAPNVTIADLTITNIRNHGVSIKGEHGANATHIYNVHLYDVGTQHIKGTPSSSNGVIACSKIGYTPGGVRGDYINAIDIHGATNWVIRDNEIYNIWGDGSGCEVDIDCGTYLPGGGPAILLWNHASGNVVERNLIRDSFRGIALGFGTTHSGGAVRNNFFFQSSAQQNGVAGDAGISIWGSNTEIDHNTIILGTDYPGAIEIQDSTNVQIRNNLISEPVWNRGNSTCNQLGNKTDATPADLVAPGDPHLDPASGAVDFPTAIFLPDVSQDIDGEDRPQGTGPDSGCDELGTGTAQIFEDSFESGDTSRWESTGS